MSSKEEIYLDYQNALEHAEELQLLAGRIRELGKAEETTANLLKTGWSGENGDAFLKKLRAGCQKTQTLSEMLESAGEALRQTAQNTYEAELRAIQIAEARLG